MYTQIHFLLIALKLPEIFETLFSESVACLLLWDQIQIYGWSSFMSLATIRQSSGSYQSGVQRWFPPETSPGYNRSGICPAGCPALAAPSVSHPPSRSLSFHLIGALGLPTEARDRTWQQLLHVLYIIWCLQRCISHQWVTSWPVFCAILLVG